MTAEGSSTSPRTERGSLAAERLAALTVYRALGALAKDSLAQLVGPLECEETAVAGADGASARACHVVLSCVAEEGELCLSLVVAPESASALVGEILGLPDPDAAMIDDMMLELANIIGGVCKVAALREHAVFTGSLPRVGRADGAGALAERAWWLRRPGTATRVGVVATVRHRENELVRAGDLREGMVVAHEVVNLSGSLVARQSTRITQVGAVRIAYEVGAAHEVDVAVVK